MSVSPPDCERRQENLTIIELETIISLNTVPEKTKTISIDCYNACFRNDSTEGKRVCRISYERKQVDLVVWVLRSVRGLSR